MIRNMIPLIARQSVIIKCNMQRAYILGNYEYYYGAGVAGKICGFEIPEDIRPKELGKLLAEQLTDTNRKGEQEQYLFSILKQYDPEERYDEQMKELLLWGKEETCLWQVSVTH